jgi:hypothetical protein
VRRAPESFRFDFPGALLRRGFWLYVWKVSCGRDCFLYVGRTGDSSSRNAASPFSRIGAHLNMKKNAKANTLFRKIELEKFDPYRCTFRFLAFGPLMLEARRSDKTHRHRRDRIASLEKGLASYLKERGYDLRGSHGVKGAELPQSLRRAVDRAFPRRPPRARSGAG